MLHLIIKSTLVDLELTVVYLLSFNLIILLLHFCITIQLPTLIYRQPKKIMTKYQHGFT